jgi:DUF4097 and DUF4098 domain-containing protein YvlB
MEQSMESPNRSVWIFITAILLVACCCLLAVTAIVLGRAAFRPAGWDWAASHQQESIERTFSLGDAPDLRIDHIAGPVTVRAGEGDEIRVRATKRAANRSDLDRIQVKMSQRDGALQIETSQPAGLSGAWVELEVATPASTRLDLHVFSGSVDVRGLRDDVAIDSGSGSVTVAGVAAGVDVDVASGSLTIQDITGPISAGVDSGGVSIAGVRGDVGVHTGSGSIEVREASGNARLDSSSGSIDYQGTPRGDCRFTTKSGSITLLLPAGLDARVDLRTGSGEVDVDFAVDGQVTKRRVKGAIGSGDEGQIYAHTLSGSVRAIQR